MLSDPQIGRWRLPLSKYLEIETIICPECSNSIKLTLTDLYSKNLEYVACNKCGVAVQLTKKILNIIIFLTLVISNAVLLFYSWNLSSWTLFAMAVFIDIALPIWALKISIALRKNKSV